MDRKKMAEGAKGRWFASDESQQTKTEGFGVPHVLRDFVSVSTARRCLIFSARARSSSQKKDAEIARVCKTRDLFQSHRMRLKRARAFFPPREGIGLTLRYLTSKWMSRSIIEQEDKKKKRFTFYTSIQWIFKKCVIILNFILDYNILLIYEFFINY